MKTKSTKAPRLLHFYSDMSGQTACGKSNSHVRSTSVLWTWDNPLVAGGRRCPDCAPAVEQARALEKQDTERKS